MSDTHKAPRDDIAEALRVAVRQEDWQTIETAPKDSQ